jgi:uncharacterized membrane protein YtjA (UPF0391 family)
MVLHPQPKENLMLSWSLLFLIVALIAGVLGFSGIAGAAAGIAKLLFFIFLILLIVSAIAGALRGKGSSGFLVADGCAGGRQAW